MVFECMKKLILKKGIIPSLCFQLRQICFSIFVRSKVVRITPNDEPFYRVPQTQKNYRFNFFTRWVWNQLKTDFEKGIIVAVHFHVS
jgi:hypothetical protein